MLRKTNLNTSLIMSVFLAAMVFSIAEGRKIYVDDDGHADFSNIQSAINDANNGDIIEVQPGTYTGEGNRDIDFNGKAITVRSIEPNNPEIVDATVIDCQYTGRGFNFKNGESQDSILSGLTIKRGKIYGNSPKGSGIYFSGSSPVIEKCFIIDSETSGGTGEPAYGGGLYIDSNSAPVLYSCVITRNKTQGGKGPSSSIGHPGDGRSGYGGGIYCGANCLLTLYNCQVTDNEARGGNGGSSMLMGGSGGDGQGGGIYLSPDTELTIVNCQIGGNRANCGLGYHPSQGIPGYDGDAYGGGVCCDEGSKSTVKNCLIAKNEVIGGDKICYWSGPRQVCIGGKAHGGGMYFGKNSTAIIGNCTIADNILTVGDSITYGAGVSCAQYSTSQIKNCIIWGNDGADQIYGSLIVSYSDVEDGYIGIGNINAAPLFVTGWLGDYYLSQIFGGQDTDSPCINTGSDTSINLGLDKLTTCTDGFGDEGIVDIGYHYDIADPPIVLAPNGAEILITGEIYPIRWEVQEHIIEVLIEYSVDNGSIWIGVEPPNSGNSGSYDWYVPAISSDQCLVRITDTADLSNSDISDDMFIIILAPPTIRLVPSQYGTIQAAIDVAIHGDIVIVSDGIYTGEGNRDIDFLGKAITLRSENGPHRCIIDCQGTKQERHGGFNFGSNERANSILDGFTITNCYDRNPINCSRNSSPTIRNCIMIGNSSWCGGVQCHSQSSPQITNCIIAYNSGTYCGGIYCDRDSNPKIVNCTISNNICTNYSGGAVRCEESSPAIFNSIIWNNSPDEIYVDDGSAPLVTYSDIQGSWEGESNIDCDPCFIFVNDFHLSRYSPCIDRGNNNPSDIIPTADLEGIGRPLDGDGDGTDIVDIGAYEYSEHQPRLAISPSEFAILHKPGEPNDEECELSLRNAGGGTLAWEINPCCSWLEVSPQTGESTDGVTKITIIADTNVLEAGIYYTSLIISTPQAVNILKIVPVTINVGMVKHVPSEYATIQDAIDACIDGDVVILAPQTYTGQGNRDIKFNGKAVTVCSMNPNDSSIVTNTIIDCNGTATDYHRGFSFYEGETSDSELKGVTITHGFSTTGSGILIHSASSPAIANCLITENEAIYGGGGIWCNNHLSNPLIVDCVISNNSANFAGGILCDPGSGPFIKNCRILNNTGDGIFCHSDSPVLISNCIVRGNTERGILCDSNDTVINCLISDNGNFGIICYSDSEVLIDNCIIENNVSGGISIWQRTSALIKNCNIIGNVGVEVGGIYNDAGSLMTLVNSNICLNKGKVTGGIYGWRSEPVIINCSIWGNVGDERGGIYYRNSSNLMLTNTILWNNFPGQMYTDWFSAAIVRYCDVQGGKDGLDLSSQNELTWGEGNIEADPCFVMPGYWVDANDPNIIVEPNDPRAVCIEGDYHLLPDSPCIDAGDPNFVAEPNETDLDGNPRILDGDDDSIPVIDMGAYEFFNTRPVADAGNDQIVECACNTEESTKVILDGSGSYDADMDVLTYTWTGPFIESPTHRVAPTVTLDGGCPGEYVIALVVDDGIDESEPNEVVINVVDTRPPEFEFSVSPMMLWPPNHKMVEITPSWTVSDECDPSPEVSLVSVVANEGDDIIGDGHTSNDIQIDDDGFIFVRSERSGTNTGRIYTITYQAVDDCGNTTVRSATVGIPHDFKVLAGIASRWLWINHTGNLPEDLNGDGIVNLKDIAIFANNWIK